MFKEIKEFKFCTESDARCSKRGRYNQASVLIVNYKKRRYVAELKCGSDDDVDFWIDHDKLIVVCVNTRMDYCGLDVYHLGNKPDDIHEKLCEAEEYGDIFLQSSEQIDEILGKNALERLTLRTIARRLYEVILP